MPRGLRGFWGAWGGLAGVRHVFQLAHNRPSTRDSAWTLDVAQGTVEICVLALGLNPQGFARLNLFKIPYRSIA